jgi:CTP:molybdopterin cytidylyltransferase MocA
MAPEKLTAHAVILAGGRGTRFWPRSRTRTPKQLLNIIGADSMLQQTVARLEPFIPAERIWTVTNAEQSASVRKQLPASARKRILAEPVGRSTAAAIALAAVHIRHSASGDALMAVLPADLYIAQPTKYAKIAQLALKVAHPAQPARHRFWLYPVRAQTRFDLDFCSLPCSSIQGETGFAVGKEICRLRKLPLERRDVFLARLDFPGFAKKIFARNLRSTRDSRQHHRYT